MLFTLLKVYGCRSSWSDRPATAVRVVGVAGAVEAIEMNDNHNKNAVATATLTVVVMWLVSIVMIDVSNSLVMTLEMVVPAA